ncbi:MAG: aminomethyl-transferring glycine dehydrogenase subunit GcvPB [Bdellovibrionota bacterium]|nr:aminomethyl-transferring glycine dehydrogenase subunit GcvPB [Bdellovibrionota bacterium]
MTSRFEKLPYDPEKLERELKPYFISADDEEIGAMLSELGLSKLEDLFSHIPDEVKFDKSTYSVCRSLSYEEALKQVELLANNNKINTSFLGQGLAQYRVHELIPYVSSIRGLTTAYTPYQPERSQGTLQTLWVYSSCLSQLTGFEAINASLYERSTCLAESLNVCLRLHRKGTTVLVSETIFPGDKEVVETLIKETGVLVEWVPVDNKTGLTSIEDLKGKAERLSNDKLLAGIIFPQVNSLGLLESVDALTDLAASLKVPSVAIFDPMLLATGGLKPPSRFGSEGQGVDIIVGEGQHLAIGPNYGGPGLGIFGVRYNSKNKNGIRSTPGRYVGKTKDVEGKECLAMVLSTREQHIRREKATSNICSNQSFLATLAGAGMLARGEEGMKESCQKGRQKALQIIPRLLKREGVSLAYPETPFFNEVALEVNVEAAKLLENAKNKGIDLGVNLTPQINNQRQLILLSFSDIHEDSHLESLEAFFVEEFPSEKKGDASFKIPEIPSDLLRSGEVGLPQFSLEDLKKFYTDLGNQNVSPDDSIYPLGSCTMKYNPYINDYAASLPGFTDLHPQVPLSESQGSLEVLYEIQEMFKKVTGLPGVTTQPVAGAQGELVGIKMFQAYHRSNGEGETRDVILIPRSAHGTNPATASMAGFETKIKDGVQCGIVTIDSDDKGEIDQEQFYSMIEKYGKRIAGIMVTNPNTAGIFETNFKEMADKIHEVGGLVYMDGANMNAIAGWVDLNALGVDAVHNNLHKTWTIPHGGGGPGDAIVAVSEKLLDFLPGVQIDKVDGLFTTKKPKNSIGSFHRHYGNFAHKVRAFTYMKLLGTEGIRKMAAVSVLAAKYLYKKLKEVYPTLPSGCESVPRMHEFIITLSEDDFQRIEQKGTPKAQTIAKVGKLFLDYGMHAPTVAFPEVYGLMVEPTESFTKKELDRFFDIVKSIYKILHEAPEVLQTVPHFTPVRKIDEVGANKNLLLFEHIKELPKVFPNVIEPSELTSMETDAICEKIKEHHNLSKS